MAAILDLCKLGGENTSPACVLILNVLYDHFENIDFILKNLIQ